MTADIINLKRVRKAKAQAEKAEQSANNRAKFGQTKSDRQRIIADQDRADRSLDGAHLGDVVQPAANEAGFRNTADPVDDDLDPGAVS